MCQQEVLESPHFKVPERREPCKVQYLLTAKLPEPFHQLQVPAQCLCNESLGIKERVFGDITVMSQFALEQVRRTMSEIKVMPVKLDHRTLLLNCPDGKRKNYSKALDSLLVYPVTDEDRKVKAFVKMERLELLKSEKFKEPRIIQARMPRYNVALGALS